MSTNRRESPINTFYELVRAGLFSVHGEGGTAPGRAKRQSRASEPLFRDVDWEKVYQLAQEQSASGLVLAGLEHSDIKPPKELLLQWIGEVQMIEQRNKEMNAFVADLIERLRKENINAILVKGQGIAQCYEKPLWRACGDVDLFLSGEDYNKAKAFLMPLASSVETEYENSKHLGMNIDGWTVELHGSLRGSFSRRINREMESVQDDTFKRGDVRVWDNGGVSIYLLGKENDIVYVFAHFLNHFYKEGVGLRQICDWCRLLWTYRDEIDVKKVESRIRRMGLVSEWKAFYNLASRYLGMPDLDSSFMFHDSRYDKKADRIMEFILKSGNMGHNRDMSHFNDKPYFTRKCISMGRRIGDLINHARIFPLDSLRFFPNIMFNGVRSAMRGE